MALDERRRDQTFGIGGGFPPPLVARLLPIRYIAERWAKLDRQTRAKRAPRRCWRAQTGRARPASRRVSQAGGSKCFHESSPPASEPRVTWGAYEGRHRTRLVDRVARYAEPRCPQPVQLLASNGCARASERWCANRPSRRSRGKDLSSPSRGRADAGMSLSVRLAYVYRWCAAMSKASAQCWAFHPLPALAVYPDNTAEGAMDTAQRPRDGLAGRPRTRSRSANG